MSIQNLGACAGKIAIMSGSCAAAAVGITAMAGSAPVSAVGAAIFGACYAASKLAGNQVLYTCRDLVANRVTRQTNQLGRQLWASRNEPGFDYTTAACGARQDARQRIDRIARIARILHGALLLPAAAAGWKLAGLCGVNMTFKAALLVGGTATVAFFTTAWAIRQLYAAFNKTECLA